MQRGGVGEFFPESEAGSNKALPVQVIPKQREFGFGGAAPLVGELHFHAVLPSSCIIFDCSVEPNARKYDANFSLFSHFVIFFLRRLGALLC